MALFSNLRLISQRRRSSSNLNMHAHMWKKLAIQKWSLSLCFNAIEKLDANQDSELFSKENIQNKSHLMLELEYIKIPQAIIIKNNNFYYGKKCRGQFLVQKFLVNFLGTVPKNWHR